MNESEKKKRAGFILNGLIKIYPDAKTELENWETDFQFLICVILSAQTTDNQVNSVTKGLFNSYPDVFSLANANIYDVSEMIFSVNYYKTKSRHIVSLSRLLVDNFGGSVPKDAVKLMGLPGVGKKTANVFLNELFQLNQGIPVDTHVARVSKRLDLTSETSVVKVSSDLECIFEKSCWYKVNTLFVLFGRYNCKAKKPLCCACVLRDICESRFE